LLVFIRESYFTSRGTPEPVAHANTRGNEHSKPSRSPGEHRTICESRARALCRASHVYLDAYELGNSTVRQLYGCCRRRACTHASVCACQINVVGELAPMVKKHQNGEPSCQRGGLHVSNSQHA